MAITTRARKMGGGKTYWDEAIPVTSPQGSVGCVNPEDPLLPSILDSLTLIGGIDL